MMTTKITSKLKFLQQQKQTTKFWNITWDQGLFLSSLIEIKKPKKILEIGTSNGFSTLWLAKDLPQTSTIDTIEINETRYNCAKRNFEDAGITNITQYLGEAFEILPKLVEKYDFIFVDAAHQFYRKTLDKLEQLNLLQDDYTVVFDNVSTHKQLSDFREYAKTKYFSQYISLGGGFLILKKLN